MADGNTPKDGEAPTASAFPAIHVRFVPLASGFDHDEATSVQFLWAALTRPVAEQLYEQLGRQLYPQRADEADAKQSEG